jgi:hypothetical protein
MMINLDKSYYMNLNSHEISILSGSIPRFIELLLVIGPISVKSRPRLSGSGPRARRLLGLRCDRSACRGRLALLRPR